MFDELGASDGAMRRQGPQLTFLKNASLVFQLGTPTAYSLRGRLVLNK